jgi:hypothetical protein
LAAARTLARAAAGAAWRSEQRFIAPAGHRRALAAGTAQTLSELRLRKPYYYFRNERQISARMSRAASAATLSIGVPRIKSVSASYFSLERD